MIIIITVFYYLKIMLVLQSKDTFIRTTEKYGYILNQKTKLERMYNETGVDYLNILARKPIHVESIIREKILPLYSDATFEEIYDDFCNFIEDLRNNGFVFIGSNLDEVLYNEKVWYDNLYLIGNSSFSQHVNQDVNLSTQEMALDFAKENNYLMSLQFELTSRCNERCIHCYIPNKKKDNGIDLPFRLFKKAIDQFSEMGGLQVSLSGGEIFLHRDILDMIKYCREKDMQISLLSNLISLNKEQVKIIKEANVSIVQASLYSMDEKIHDSITQVKGSYTKTRNAIELLVKERIPVMISCPLMKANANSYHNILQYAHSLGIKAQTDFILMAKEDLDTTNLNNRISLSETENVIKEILLNAGVDSVDSISDNTQPSKVLLKLSQPVCAAGITNLCINANGNIFPCNGWQGFKAGNLYKESLNKIWETSDSLKELRSITRASFVECVDCEAKDYCSICMARNYNESNGNHLKINTELCKIAHLNKKVHEEILGNNVIN